MFDFGKEMNVKNEIKLWSKMAYFGVFIFECRRREERSVENPSMFWKSTVRIHGDVHDRRLNERPYLFFVCFYVSTTRTTSA